MKLSLISAFLQILFACCQAFMFANGNYFAGWMMTFGYLMACWQYYIFYQNLCFPVREKIMIKEFKTPISLFEHSEQEYIALVINQTAFKFPIEF